MAESTIAGQEEDFVTPERRNYFAIDALKAFAIALVVLDHSLTWELKHAIGGPFWERTSIPFFLIIMGFNLGLSFKRSGAKSLKELYSRVYLNKKLTRYVGPFLVLYAASYLVGLYFNSLTWDAYSFLLFLPFSGPGNWFIPVLFTSVLVLPLVYWAYIRYPKITVLLCFLSEILLGLFLFFNVPLVWDGSAFTYFSYEAAFIATTIRVTIPFYLPAVGLGLWFSDGWDIRSKRNRLMWIAFPLSVAYISAYHFLDFRVQIESGGVINRLIWGDYTLLIYPYAAFFFLLALMYLPASPGNKLSRFIARVGKASYHIYLFQDFYFSFWYNLTDIGHMGFEYPLLHLPFYMVNIAICLIGGIGWRELEQRATTDERSWWNHPWMVRIRYLTAAGLSLLLMTIVIELILVVSGLIRVPGDSIPYWAFTQETAPIVLFSFVVILFFIGLSIRFLWKAFESSDEPILD